MLDKQEYMHARTRTHICNTYYFSTATVIREHASVLRYTHIACVVVTAQHGFERGEKNSERMNSSVEEMLQIIFEDIPDDDDDDGAAFCNASLQKAPICCY